LYRPEAFLQELDRLLTPDHRLLIVSHVSCIDGRRMPVIDATRLAHGRGVKVLVDGAQSVGQFPVNVAEIGSEFYAGSVHKWLLGPSGIGYLVVSRRQLPEFNPFLMPQPPRGDPSYGGQQLSAAGQLEIGTQSASLRVGTVHVIEMLQRIGLRRIEAHVRELTSQLRDDLARAAGFTVLTPKPWELSSAITSLEFCDRSAERVHRLIKRMWLEHRVVVKFQSEFSGIRVSVASFNSPEEIDRLVRALATLVPQM
jgi:L-cysteine/cystine lyase